jgi:hypothetical protein
MSEACSTMCPVRPLKLATPAMPDAISARTKAVVAI